MLTIENLQLIDGKFIPENAREILTDLIKSKIQFHKRNKLNGNIVFSESRINELENMLIIIESIIDEAAQKNKKIIINGIIDIKLVD
jgi:hypothetical protein